VSVALLVVTDGRDDYLRQCVRSLQALDGSIGERWMFDDTGDRTYRQELAVRYPEFQHINAGPRQGCAGAVQAAWGELSLGSTCSHILHVEQDFVFTRQVDLAAMASLLNRRPYLAQVALRRQPCNQPEQAAGGVVEQHPSWYTDQSDGGADWLEHRAFWTCNPCLYRRTLLRLGWPPHQPGRYSEDTFHRRLLADGTPEVPGADVRYAYWGARDSGVWVRHVGVRRATKGHGY
jgi:hypothetical protein